MAKATCACRGSCLAARPSPGGYEPSDTRHLAPTGDGGHTRLAWGGIPRKRGQTARSRWIQLVRRGAHHTPLRPAPASSSRCGDPRQSRARTRRSTGRPWHPDGDPAGVPHPAGRRRFGCLRQSIGRGESATEPTRRGYGTSQRATTVQAFGEHDNSFGPWTSESTALCRGAGFSASPPDCLRQAAFKQLTNFRSMTDDACWPSSTSLFPSCASESSARAGNGTRPPRRSGVTRPGSANCVVWVGRSSISGGVISMRSMTCSARYARSSTSAHSDCEPVLTHRRKVRLTVGQSPGE